VASQRVERVFRAYQRQVIAVRSRTDAAVARAWRALPDYREEDIKHFAAAVVPVVTGGQRLVAALTDAHLAHLEEAVLRDPVRPVGIPAAVTSISAIRGVDAREVYRRPGLTVWSALSRGARFPDAVAAGLSRARGLAATDIQLAKTHTARYVLASKPHVVGYRRVAEADACAVCAVAASETYSSDDLLPIHANCDCGVEPIYADADPGELEQPDPEDTEERFGSKDADEEDVVVHEHGELGPVLAVRGQDFTGPDDF
jgi:hypothetical protein